MLQFVSKPVVNAESKEFSKGFSELLEGKLRCRATVVPDCTPYANQWAQYGGSEDAGNQRCQANAGTIRRRWQSITVFTLRLRAVPL
jgi:hypothetical protein